MTKKKKKKLLRCNDVASHICEHLDVGMDSAQCREIKAHIESCPNCYAYLDSMRKTVRLYKLETAPRVPTGARRKLFAVLKLTESAPRS